MARVADGKPVNLHQLTPSDRGILKRVAIASTHAGAAALGKLCGIQVDVGTAQFEVSSLGETLATFDTLPSHMTVVYVEVHGKISGQLVFICPAASATAIIGLIISDIREFGLDRALARRDAMGEVGNIVLSSFLNSMVEMTGLTAEPSTPMVALDVPSAVLELPIARAASDSDIVVRFNASFALGGSGIATTLRAPMHVLFLPAPGGLSSILDVLDDNRPRSELRIPVRMGELAVSRRSGDVLVANALGSCVAIALLDRLSGVGALAHVMLPVAPDRWSLHGRPTYAARYANTAVPALLNALERAGGRRVCTQAYIAGGGQMFTGSLASTIDIPDRNVQAVRAALAQHGIAIDGDETGGTSSRTLELDIAHKSVIANIDGIRPVRLNAA